MAYTLIQAKGFLFSKSPIRKTSHQLKQQQIEKKKIFSNFKESYWLNGYFRTNKTENSSVLWCRPRLLKLNITCLAVQLHILKSIAPQATPLGRNILWTKIILCCGVVCRAVGFRSKAPRLKLPSRFLKVWWKKFLPWEDYYHGFNESLGIKSRSLDVSSYA